MVYLLVAIIIIIIIIITDSKIIAAAIIVVEININMVIAIIADLTDRIVENMVVESEVIKAEKTFAIIMTITVDPSSEKRLF